MAKEKKKEVTIHERGGKFDDNLTIYDIEKAFHPRSKEIIKEELTGLLEDFIAKHVDKKTGSIKDADAAVDSFLESLAKYHFGEAYEAVKEDTKHVTQTLEKKYGVDRNALRRAFLKKGAYKDRDDFYRVHRDPLVDKADQTKKEHAQESLNFYIHDEHARDEIPAHLEKRTGRALNDTYKKTVDLETTVQLIGNYMALPGAIETIEKNKKATLTLPETHAGHPSISHAFKEGDKYHKTYLHEAETVDSSHKLKTKKYKKAA